MLLAGGIPITIPCRQEDDFKLRPEQLQAALTPRTKLVVLGFPIIRPVCVLEKSEVEALAEVLRNQSVLVLSDELYAELTYEPASHYSIAAAAGMRDKTVVINGFSKAFA